MKVQIIGKRLKDVRDEYKLTQKDLAEILCISAQALSKKEKLDKTTLSETQVRLIETQIHVHRDFLIGNVEKPYELIGTDGKTKIYPLKKDVYLYPISNLAQTFDKEKAKKAFIIMDYINQANDGQVDLLIEICNAIFKNRNS